MCVNKKHSALTYIHLGVQALFVDFSMKWIILDWAGDFLKINHQLTLSHRLIRWSESERESQRLFRKFN